ncbi:predicted protein [Nematostella vectensis]|uniref:EF-hand domain-containing protein n=1 Tax=Nematostella vectensis TaxID=45351 RepID=A7RRJ7_NEMVE|nr:predicted protein [Nematostella vectensis]|eukprot:XP_001638030.1 predicted protein [Nematostella vectensis]
MADKATKLSPVEFVKVFMKFDSDKNGYIEEKEMDLFIHDLLKELNDKEPTKAEVADKKKEILEKYDLDKDGRFSMDELENILPVEPNLLRTYLSEGKRIGSVDFMKIFTRFDEDKSGFLETVELRGFFHELLSMKGKSSINPRKLDDYIEYCLEKYDANKDGKFNLNELAKMLPLEENIFETYGIKRDMTREDFNKVWDYYDKDNSGEIEGDEILALLHDVLKQQQPDREYNKPDLERFRDIILEIYDENKDNKLSRDELCCLLSASM